MRKIFDRYVGELTVRRELYVRSKHHGNPDGKLCDLMCITEPLYPVFTINDVIIWLDVDRDEAKAMMKDAVKRKHFFQKGIHFSQSLRALNERGK